MTEKFSELMKDINLQDSGIQLIQSKIKVTKQKMTQIPHSETQEH